MIFWILVVFLLFCFLRFLFFNPGQIVWVAIIAGSIWYVGFAP